MGFPYRVNFHHDSSQRALLPFFSHSSIVLRLTNTQQELYMVEGVCGKTCIEFFLLTLASYTFFKCSYLYAREAGRENVAELSRESEEEGRASGGQTKRKSRHLDSCLETYFVAIALLPFHKSLTPIYTIHWVNCAFLHCSFPMSNLMQIVTFSCKGWPG